MVELGLILKKLFIVIAVISCVTCYARPDYNLPLFAFAYLLWDQTKPCSQKQRLVYLFTFTWIVDFIWLIYWGPFWDSELFAKNWAKGIQTFVLFFSVVNFILKLIVIVGCVQSEAECKHALSPEGFIQNAKEIFNTQDQQNQPNYGRTQQMY